MLDGKKQAKSLSFFVCKDGTCNDLDVSMTMLNMYMIREVINDIQNDGERVTYIKIARRLNIPRWRASRIVKALNLSDLLRNEPVCKHCTTTQKGQSDKV